MVRDRRKARRRSFSYYMRVINARSDAPLGHLTDISAGGFQLDCQEPPQENRAYQMRIDVPAALSPVPYLRLVGRCKWCRVDPIDYHTYNAGFKIEEITPEGVDIFRRMFDEYASDTRPKATNDYLWT